MEILKSNFPELPSSQLDKLIRLKPVYTEWNQKVNLISRQDMENFYERHVLFSLSIKKIIDFQPNTNIIDIGTGGGFPGIPLAIVFPEVKFTLIDSIGKKIKIVNAVIQELNLKNVTAIATRSENCKEKFDFILGRAVTALPDFFRQTKHLIKKPGNNALPNGCIYLGGGDTDQKIISLLPSYREWKLNTWYKGEFFQTKKILHFTYF